MTVPPLRKWRMPRAFLHRVGGMGWQLFVDVHPDHNPILIVSRWCGKWYVEAFERVIYRTKTP